MQIVIPMSGFGERFRKAGYTVPKPLIQVEGKPIIAHVVDMFPNEADFLFICNEDHLADGSYRLEEVLRDICPSGRVAAVAPHREGPIGAVLSIRDRIDPVKPTIVNYCDFTCYWDFADFTSFVKETDCAGAVPAYRGFHPHSLGSTYYAYVKQAGLWIQDIQEKQPFTDTPSEEFASSGTYYFESGALCLDLFQEVRHREMRVNGEYYASMAYKVLVERGARVAVYELEHFMQWGTPQDLAEYTGFSDAFRRLAGGAEDRARQDGSILIPMAGYGKRFADAGYARPKPLIPVSGRPMVLQAIGDLPKAAVRCVLRADMPGLDEIVRELEAMLPGLTVLVLGKGTDGQATTSRLGLEALDPAAPVTIGACDNGMLYEASAFEALLAQAETDVLVWVIRGHADARRRPGMFGWVEADTDGRVTGVRVKDAPVDPSTAPMIVGAFTFRRAEDFCRAYDRLRGRDARVNGEFYVDTMIEDAVALGLSIRLFEIDSYLGWGTPDDLRTFEYWQSCFHKWTSHPYRLERDRRVDPEALAGLEARFRARRPKRPTVEGGSAPQAPVGSSA